MKLKLFILTFLVACTLRLAFVYFYPHQVMSSDSIEYNNIAVNLMSGHGYSIVPDVPTARRAPAYPLFLIAIYKVFGTGPIPVEVAQSVIGALTCFLAYFLAREVFNERAARTVLFATALYPILIAYCGLILTEIIFTFFLLACAFLFVRSYRSRSIKDFLLFGLVFGVTVLIRADVILLPFFIAAVLIIGWKDKLLALRRIALFLIGALIPFIPWSIYSYSHFHYIFPGHAGGLGPLVRGSAEYAVMGTTEFDPASKKKLDDYYASLGVYAAPEKNERQLVKDGTKIILRHPIKFVMLAVHRFPKFWITSHSAVMSIQRTNGEYLQEKKYHVLALKTLLLVLQLVIISAALLGFLLVPKKTGEVVFLSILFAYPMLYLFVDNAARHHIPFTPYFFMFAGAGILPLWDKLRLRLTR